MKKPTNLYIEVYPISEEHISGIGHMTLELIRALEKHPQNQKSFQIVLVVNRDRKDRLLRWRFKTVKYKTIPVPTRLFNVAWKFNMLPPMDLFLGKGAYIFPNYKNWWLLSSKSLTFICDISYLLYPQFVSPKNQKFLAENVKKWVKRADKVLVISKNAQSEIIDNLHIKAEKTLLVPCGVDTKVFYKRSKQEIERLKKACGITKDYILYLGNIEPRKNLIRLLNAYKLLQSELREKYTLVLVGGSGWLNEPIIKAILKAQSGGYDIVKPTQYIPDEKLPALYSGATILVHPALYEGFGLSPLQAMACGTPTLVGNNSSLPEVVGNAGILVDAENESDIAAKMEAVLTDGKRRLAMRVEGLKQAQKFTWDKSAQQLLNYIEEVSSK